MRAPTQPRFAFAERAIKTGCLALVAVLFCSKSFAEIVWENRTAELTAGPTDQQLEAHYRFRNAGDHPVKIRSFHTSCGCTAASAAKDDIAPGANGEITVVFNIQNRIGHFHESAEVEIDGEKDDAILALSVVVPSILSLEPPGPVIWKAPEALRSRELTIHLEKGLPPATLTATSSNPLFSVTATPLPDGRSFKLVILPAAEVQNSARPVGTVIALKTKFPAGDGRTATVIAQYRK